MWATFEGGSYEYDIKQSCFCPSPNNVHVTVINGVVASATPINGTNDGNTTTLTVQQLFDIISDAQQGNGTADITYDIDYGFPSLVSLDPIIGAVDDETSYSIKNFQLIESGLNALALQKSAWSDRQINSYTMDLFVDCFCIVAGEINIRVSNGEAVSAYSVNAQRELSTEEMSDIPTSIAALFALAENIMLAGQKTIEITYNATYNIPSTVEVDKNLMIADAGVSYTISNFAVTTD